MKKKLTRIWGVGLVVVMISTLLLSAAPISAGTLGYGSETLPSTTNNLLVTTAGLDVLDLAVAGDGMTMYAVTGAVDNQIYKSTDGGHTWSGLTAPTITNANLIAVAPDDPDIVIVFGGVATNLVAFASTNGGSTWSSLGTVQDNSAVGASQIWDIAVSPPDGSKHYIAAAGTDGGGPALYYFDLGAAAPSWTDAVADFTTPFVPGLIASFRTVEFSPNFSSDLVAVAVSEEVGALSGPVVGVARFHMLSFNQKAWDAAAGFGTYPVTLETDTTPAGAYTVPDAAISLDPNYLGGDDSSRIAFVGLSVLDAGLTTPEIGGVYRVKDTSVKQIYDSNIGINSVGWDGSNLVASPTASNVIKRSADALATTPTFSSATSLKRPGGATQPLVSWVGSDVVSAATGAAGATAAVAVSDDNGKTFTDGSLIDTVVTTISDVWVTDDGTIFMLTSDTVAGTTSLWRKTSVWQRVWWIGNTNGYIVRGAPDGESIYPDTDSHGQRLQRALRSNC